MRPLIAAGVLLSLVSTRAHASEHPFFYYYRADGTPSVSAEMTLESAADYWRGVKGISNCVFVLGRTDTVGPSDENLRLSIMQAERVRDRLVELGIDPTVIRVSGKGETLLDVPTADEVAEPLNRNVEVRIEFDACPPLPSSPEAQ